MLICGSALLASEYTGGPRCVKMCANYSPNEFCVHASLRAWNSILRFSELVYIMGIFFFDQTDINQIIHLLNPQHTYTTQTIIIY